MEAKIELENLIRAFLSGAFGVEWFCTQYEKTFNFDVDRNQLSQMQEAIFRTLFDEVVGFSPFHDELATIPLYRSEAQIREAAENAWQRLEN